MRDSGGWRGEARQGEARRSRASACVFASVSACVHVFISTVWHLQNGIVSANEKLYSENARAWVTTGNSDEWNKRLGV